MPPLSAVLLCALAHSIGWGIRGNWGHEYGAMIPGALSAIAACLIAGREDWRRRVVHFAFFGAMGWSFGGSMSYGLVQGYTHTASPPNVFFGFAMLFVIGFLWGAVGGAGAALPAYWDRESLTDFYPPLITIFCGWFLWEYPLGAPDFDWFDTDWAGVLVLLISMAAYLAARRKVTEADKLILTMAAGWWAGFLLLVVLLGLHMTPPRGDNWAGCLGMTIAMLLYLRRREMTPLIWMSLFSGLMSGIGFSSGQLIRVFGFAGPLAINWHSVLEQSFGFLSGVGTAIGMYRISQSSPPLEETTTRRWVEPFAFCFLMLVVTYINIVKNVHTIWLPQKQIPVEMLGVAAVWWFRLAYLALAGALIWLTRRHMNHGLAIVPPTWLGRGQLLFLFFLWWIVVGNLSRYLPFQPGRLVTEGVIHLNACLASVLILGIRAETVERKLQPLFPLARLAALAMILVMTYATLCVTVIDKEHRGARYRFGPKAESHRD